jgi:hypothetical protein
MPGGKALAQSRLREGKVEVSMEKKRSRALGESIAVGG